MAKAAAHPIPSGDADDKRTADDGAVLLGVISALYDEDAVADTDRRSGRGEQERRVRHLVARRQLQRAL